MKNWDDLKKAAFQTIYDNYNGMECEGWKEALIENYPEEVVDVLGENPFTVFPVLSNMWECDDYRDPQTGICMTYGEWAEFSSNSFSHLVYDKTNYSIKFISF